MWKKMERGGESSAATSEARLFHVSTKQLPNEKNPEVARRREMKTRSSTQKRQPVQNKHQNKNAESTG